MLSKTFIFLSFNNTIRERERKEIERAGKRLPFVRMSTDQVRSPTNLEAFHYLA